MMVGLTQTPGRSFVSFADFVLLHTKYLRVVEVVSVIQCMFGRTKTKLPVSDRDYFG